jgi:AcrR family transcriptional regulator
VLDEREALPRLDAVDDEADADAPEEPLAAVVGAHDLHACHCAIAERAGVRRSTVYRHFPDEEALFAACSSHWATANPPPDPRSWSSIDDPAERTRAALRDLYAFYGRTEAMFVSLLRDEPLVPAVERGSATSTATSAPSRTVSPRAAVYGAAARGTSAPRSATRWRFRRGAR